MARKQIVAGLIILATASAAVQALADDNPATKLGRGILNATTGWLEIPKQTVAGAREAGVPGLLDGLVLGVAEGAARTLVRGFEVGTFWAPIPKGYAPVMKPVSVFDGR